MKKYVLRKKIEKLYLIGFVGIIILCVVGMYIVSVNTYIKQSYGICESLVNVNLNLMDKNLQQIQEGQKMLANDVSIIRAVSFLQEEREGEYTERLQHQRNVNDKFRTFSTTGNVNGIYIVKGDGTPLYSYEGTVDGEVLNNEKWFQDIADSSREIFSFASRVHDKSYLVNSSDEICISMVMPVYCGAYSIVSKPSAFLICDVDLDDIMENEGDGIWLMLQDYAGDCFSLDGLTYDKQMVEELLEKETRDGQDGKRDEKIVSQIRSKDHNMLLVSQKSNVFGLKVIGVKELDEITKFQTTMVLLLVLTLTVAGSLTYVLSRMTARVVVTPMNRLIEKCREVADGNYEVEFEEEANLEVSVLSQTIEGMIHDIVFFKEKAVEEEKQLAEEKLRTLQHQINPHFINNVLQTIKSLAISKDTEKISDLSTLLGKIMAYSVYQPYQIVTLGEELQHIQNYLEVQNIRFNNRILYDIECVDEKIKSSHTLKLTLQPLVENAVEHGIKTGMIETVTISAEYDNEDVAVIISDNGKGISEEELEELQKNLTKGCTYQQAKSIGILNVNERLKKKYGSAYGIELMSKLGQGTTVIVKLPGR